MAGKQYNVYAAGNITVANGGGIQTWIGALDGQVTSSGMSKGSEGNYTVYPQQGAFRLGGYYAGDTTLNIEIYENNGATLKETKKITPLTDRGYSQEFGTLDRAMKSTEMTKSDMRKASFAKTLNSNIKKINGIIDAYKIEDISLREWKLSGSRVIPAGDVWTDDLQDIDAYVAGLKLSAATSK